MNPALRKLIDAHMTLHDCSERDALLALLGDTGDVTASVQNGVLTASDEEDDADDKVEPVFQPIGSIVTEGAGERDQDPVERGGVCPACARGGPRAGALHDCGRSNAGCDPTPRYVHEGKR